MHRVVPFLGPECSKASNSEFQLYRHKQLAIKTIIVVLQKLSKTTSVKIVNFVSTKYQMNHSKLTDYIFDRMISLLNKKIPIDYGASGSRSQI